MNRHAPVRRQATSAEVRRYARVVTLRDGRRRTSYRLGGV